MSYATGNRLPLLIALALVLLCLWPLVTGAGRVLSLQSRIHAAQSQTRMPVRQDAHIWVMHANSHGAAGAALQARLRATARNSDLSLTRVEVEPRDAEDSSLLKLRAHAEGNVHAMAQFFHELENSSPVLVINTARLSAEDGKLALDMQIQARTVPETGS